MAIQMTDALTERAVSPREIDAARLGRELNRISVEDAAALSSHTEWVKIVREATRKAFAPDQADAILAEIGAG